MGAKSTTFFTSFDVITLQDYCFYVNWEIFALYFPLKSKLVCTVKTAIFFALMSTIHAWCLHLLHGLNLLHDFLSAFMSVDCNCFVGQICCVSALFALITVSLPSFMLNCVLVNSAVWVTFLDWCLGFHHHQSIVMQGNFPNKKITHFPPIESVPTTTKKVPKNPTKLAAKPQEAAKMTVVVSNNN